MSTRSSLRSTDRFWEAADRLVHGHTLVVDRPRGSRHPRFPDAVYPLDYGYLEGTAAVDGGGIDVWRGSLPEDKITGALVTVDLLKNDVEIKLLLGCSEEEARDAVAWHDSEAQAALLIER